MITPNYKGLIICPNCNKEYLPFRRRWQLISGLCSTKCWNEYLGITDGENEKNGSIRATEINEKDKVDINTPPIKTDLPTIKNNHSNVKGKVFKARIFENIERNTEVKK